MNRKRLAGIFVACAVIVVVMMVTSIAGRAPMTEPPRSLTVASTAGGSVTVPGEGGFTYPASTVVDLVAETEEGYRFVRWTGDVGTVADFDAASTAITMEGDYNVTASFELAQHTLTIDSTAGGQVTEPGEGAYTHEAGTVVGLVVQIDEGYQFVNWTGDVGTVGDVDAVETTIAMHGDYTVTANFVKEIRTWHDLSAIQHNLSGSYVLVNDLDSAVPGYDSLAGPQANQGEGWQPIGLLGDGFTGSFDGRGYEITDLFISRPNGNAVGLFGVLAREGVIANIGVVNIAMTGNNYVGGLLGDNWGGTVTNAHSSGSVTGSERVGGLVGDNRGGTVRYSYSICEVVGSSRRIGGLIGRNSGVASESHFVGSVTGDGYVGGLVGHNERGTVTNCHSSGEVTGRVRVGGLVGYNCHGAVASSYSTTSVSGAVSVGGLVGYRYFAEIRNSFWNTQTSGQATSDGGTGKTTAEMKAISSFTETVMDGLDEPWDIVPVSPGETNSVYTWNIVDGQTYPFLSWQSVS